jgi:tetratricopeptide (TPR) repeat protein
MNASRLARLMLLPLAMLAVPDLAWAENGPSLSAHVNGVRSDRTKSESLKIAELDVKVRLRGSLAETEITARFANPSRDVLEGDFSLAMPKGSVVTGYALDINGVLVDGVLESRYKAQEAYQSRVAVRVDPGLAEVDYSDRFSTRVFPITPGSGRTVRLRFVTPLDARDGYRLPLGIDAPVGTLRFSVEVSGLAGAPRIDLPSGVSGQLSEGKLVFSGQEVRIGGALAIVAAQAATALTVSEHPGEGRFFELSDRLPALPPSGAPARAVHIFWDRSVSRLDDELEAERALLGDWLRAKGAEQVGVTLFDSGAPETHEGLSPAAALALIAAQRYRGGTSYSALAETRVAPGTPCLLFSDGRATLDKTSGIALPCGVRAVISGPEADRALLTELTGNSPVEAGRGNHAAALALLLGAGSPVARLTDDAGRAVDHAQLEAAPGSWRIVGRLPDSGGLRLILANGEQRDYRPVSPVVPTFAGPGALWASRRLATIGDDAGPDERIAFARRYSVASPQAAFVVLETPEDYARSEIEPPASYPKDLLPRYQAARAAQQQLKDTRQQQLAGQLRGEWSEVVRWWESKFDPNAKPGGQKAGRAGEAEGDNDQVVVTGTSAEGSRRPRRENRSAPPPPPPPPASPAPVASSDIAVTAQRQTDRLQGAPQAVNAVGGESLARQGEDQSERSANDGRSGGAAVAKPSGSISVEPWSADRPYLAAFEMANADYEKEIDEQRRKHGAIPLFWFDLAEWHFVKGRKAGAARAVEAALDLPTRDNQTLQIVASRLLRYGSHDRAIALLERLVLIETDRPQPRRTLALALLERARLHQGKAREADLRRALGLLEEVITTAWPDQYRGIYAIALVEANRLIAQLGGREASGTRLDPALIRSLDAGVRVSAEWNTPRTDIDLWVREPSGEEVGYSHRLSARGGRYNQDMTQGYGPEEYMLRVAGRGDYEVRAKTFAADRNNPNGPSVLTLRITYDFGRPTEREELVTMEMKPEDGGMRLVGKVKVD